MEVEDVVLRLLYCLISACLSIFISGLFDSGMILRRYFVLLNYLWIKSRRRKRLRNLLKPLGLCIYCYSFWVNIIVFFVFGIPLIEALIFSGVNYYLVRALR